MLECKREKRNSQREHRQSIEQTRGLFGMCDSPLGCGLLSIATRVTLLGNEFHVRSVLHVQVSLIAVSQISVILEAINSWKNLKI